MDRLDPAAEAFIAAREQAVTDLEHSLTLEDWVAAGCPDDAPVRVRGDMDLDPHFDALLHLAKIVVEFPAFTDGRGFSVARQLRLRGFEGELIAAGDVLPDQWQYLQRCGFSGLADSTLSGYAAELPTIRAVYQAQ